MRYIVTPEFSKKLSSVTPDGLAIISAIVQKIKSSEKDSIVSGGGDFDVRSLGNEIYTIKFDCYILYISFGTDEKGEYLLLLDIAQEKHQASPARQFFATKDPRTNPQLDPNRNGHIDPRRNMMIDPRRNMMIDPSRNMMIDPRRNIMIDPRRNIMIDPRRNMRIDPRRNMMIDPTRNMMIDPRRNHFYGGPYVYTIDLQQIGFIVKANDKVDLVFDIEARFSGFGVRTEPGNVNIFDTNSIWVGFLVNTDSQVYLRFDVNNNWIGIVV